MSSFSATSEGSRPQRVAGHRAGQRDGGAAVIFASTFRGFVFVIPGSIEDLLHYSTLYYINTCNIWKKCLLRVKLKILIGIWLTRGLCLSEAEIQRKRLFEERNMSKKN